MENYHTWAESKKHVNLRYLSAFSCEKNKITILQRLVMSEKLPYLSLFQEKMSKKNLFWTKNIGLTLLKMSKKDLFWSKNIGLTLSKMSKNDFLCTKYIGLTLSKMSKKDLFWTKNIGLTLSKMSKKDLFWTKNIGLTLSKMSKKDLFWTKNIGLTLLKMSKKNLFWTKNMDPEPSHYTRKLIFDDTFHHIFTMCVKFPERLWKSILPKKSCSKTWEISKKKHTLNSNVDK